jgi:hypothetical protein
MAFNTLPSGQPTHIMPRRRRAATCQAEIAGWVPRRRTDGHQGLRYVGLTSIRVRHRAKIRSSQSKRSSPCPETSLLRIAPQAPPPSEAALASFSTLQQACLRALGFLYPEGELRQQYATTPEGRVGKERDFPRSATMLEGLNEYANIPVPALVIFAFPHRLGKMGDDSTDTKVREAAKAYSAAEVVLTTRQAKAIEDGVPTACVVRLRDADHYVHSMIRVRKIWLQSLVLKASYPKFCIRNVTSTKPTSRS